MTRRHAAHRHCHGHSRRLRRRPTDPAAAAAAPDPTGKGRGFFLTLRITCPLDQAVEYIEKDLQDALKSVAPSEKRPNLRYAVKRVWILQRNPIKEDSIRMQKLAADFAAVLAAKTAAAGVNAAPRSGQWPRQEKAAWPHGRRVIRRAASEASHSLSPGATAPPDESYNDRLTGESILEDKEFEMVLGLELDPPAWVKPVVDPNAPQTAAATPAQ